MVTDGKVGGLLGFMNDECVAWLSVDPIETQLGHDYLLECESINPPGVWAIHCVYIAPTFRGRGLSKELVAKGIHLCHHPIIPKTKLKRIVISKPIVDAIFEEVSSWDGYKFRAGKYGVQPFTLFADGLSEEFESVVTTELARVCRYVGPRIDKVLVDILAT